jgi:Mechanosensitive ion channel
VDLRERRQLEVSASVAKVRAKARPWRYIFALLLAVAGAVAAEVSGVQGWGKDLSQAHDADRFLFIGGQAAFLVFGLAAVIGLSSKARWTSQQLIGQAHAGVLRYVLVLAGVFFVLTFSLAIAHIDVKQLLVSGAVLGVLLGIAAQQSLANLVAGLVLLFARPFRVGDHVRFRAGALSGQVEGLVIDVSLTYVRLDTPEGPMLLPNSQALGAAVTLLPDRPPADLASQGSLSSGVATASAATAPAATGPSVVPCNGDPGGTVAGGTVAGGTVASGTIGGSTDAGGTVKGGTATGGTTPGGTAH